MSHGRQILRNVGALSAARGVTAVVTFITTIYLARVLEPAGYGILNWGLAFLAYFSFASDLGLGVYAMREVARSGEQAWRLPGPVLILRVAAALLTLVVYLAIVLLLDADPVFKITVGVLGLSLLAHAIELGWVYHGLERLGVVAVRNVITSLVTLAGVLFLVRRPDHVVLAAAITVAALTLPNIWLLLTYGREFGRPRFEVDFRLWWTMLIPSLPIAASHLLGTINTNLDQLMLGLMRTQTEVGWYAAAYRVITAATIPWQIVLQAYLPSLSNAIGDTDAMRERTRSYATTLYALGLPIAAGGYLFAGDIVTIFGPNYGEAEGPLAILMVSLALMYARTIFGGALVAWDRQRVYSVVLGGGAVLNLALNFALIPPYGIEGAAIATLATELVVTVGCAIAYRGLIRDVFLGTFFRAVLATALGLVAPILLAGALDLPFVMKLLAGGLGYAVAAFAFRIIPTSLLTRGTLFSD